MLKYFNKKEDERYLTFRRKRFITQGGSRTKILVDKKKMILWVKPSGLIGQPLLIDELDKITYGTSSKAAKYDGVFLIGEINAIVKNRKLLIYEIIIYCTDNKGPEKEHLRADFREMISEIVNAFKEGK